ncbi:F-ATPase epsilon subunit [Anaerohalosphaera lusitana]|uniref:ATP synthase epsilon chain n=1 Tax=Anaerohalosphaera lusitana TaxID=1936003 RepID=A0A1U9NPF5_9BACT|nr:F0F1 ATP synthase subunit epsilon [Anaerohalosphaera lusitana]AQT69386.1 F-ATPase epsilon subunit [Anaerohalosphaera lusitana]
MVGLIGRKFNLSILTPGKSLMEGKVALLNIPAHDGMRGILYNHCPMLCQLGTGIMEVHEIAGEPDRYYLVEGGLARINENHVTILAYDATNLRDMELEEAKELVRKSRELVAGKGYIQHQKKTEITPEKARLLVHLAELDKFDETES